MPKRLKHRRTFTHPREREREQQHRTYIFSAYQPTISEEKGRLKQVG